MRSPRRRGTIVNIASIVAIGPEVLNGVYGGTKSFVLAFSRSLRKELAGAGVDVQVVLPGATGTEFWDIAGLPASNLPKDWVMSAADLVDASLRGLDRGFATVPSLSAIKFGRRRATCVFWIRRILTVEHSSPFSHVQRGSPTHNVGQVRGPVLR